MTDGHSAPADDPLTAAFHDADLWILAAPEQRFDAYCAQVREEYAFVDEQALPRRAQRGPAAVRGARRRSTAPGTPAGSGTGRPGSTCPASWPVCATDRSRRRPGGTPGATGVEPAPQRRRAITQVTTAVTAQAATTGPNLRSSTGTMTLPRSSSGTGLRRGRRVAAGGDTGTAALRWPAAERRRNARARRPGSCSACRRGLSPRDGDVHPPLRRHVAIGGRPAPRCSRLGHDRPRRRGRGRLCRGFLCGDGLPGRRRSSRCAGRLAAQAGGEAVGELVEDLGADVLDHAAAELRRPAGDLQVGVHDHPGACAVLLEARGDGGARGPVAALVLAVRLDHDPPGRLVPFAPDAFPGVHQRDRAELDLRRTGEVVPVHGGDDRSGEAGRDQLEVVERGPGVADRTSGP